MAETEEQKFKPGRSYDVSLKIKGIDFSQDVVSIRISSSISSAYPIVTFVVNVEPDDVVLEKIYGKENIKMSLKLLGVDQEGMGNQLDFELMFVTNSMPTPVKPDITEGLPEEKLRTSVEFLTVCQTPFKIMTSLVNEVYQAMTLKQVVEDLVGTYAPDATLDYDTDGENSEVIDQIVVPPTTIYKAIQYLDDHFGLYEGVPAIYCQYDNTLSVRNLKGQFNKSQTGTITFLSNQGKQDEVANKATDGKNFYTQYALDTHYGGNTFFANFANNLKFIVKPRDQLYLTIENDIESICSDYSLASDNKLIYMDDVISERTRYYISSTGYETTPAFMISRIAKQVSNLSTIKLMMERSIQIENLLKVGEQFKLECETQEYIPLSGKYILKSSDILLDKEGEWQAKAVITLMRTHNLNS